MKFFSTDHFNAVPFPKDQKSDHVFPSRPARSSGMPFGHLRPLGTQRKPEGHIKEQGSTDRYLKEFLGPRPVQSADLKIFLVRRPLLFSG